MSSASTPVRPLEGKLGIITGASRGIGAGIAVNLASKGCNLVLNYTSASSEAKTEELAGKLRQDHSIKCIIVRADMGSPTGPASLIAATAKHFAHDFNAASSSKRNPTIHVIVNNAGIAKNAPIAGVEVDNFQQQYAVNVLGPLLLMQAALPHLPAPAERPLGRIVNLSSVSASIGFQNQSVYGGTKAALEAMTRTWARELAGQATVNSINPGPVETDMYSGVNEEFVQLIKPWLQNTPGAVDERSAHLGGRAASVQEIAGVVGMLCTEDASWCTGSVVCANGGMRMSP